MHVCVRERVFAENGDGCPPENLCGMLANPPEPVRNGPSTGEQDMAMTSHLPGTCLLCVPVDKWEESATSTRRYVGRVFTIQKCTCLVSYLTKRVGGCCLSCLEPDSGAEQHRWTSFTPGFEEVAVQGEVRHA